MQSESSSIDPRYRPEFQRGYRGNKQPPVEAPHPPDFHEGPVEAASIDPVVVGSADGGETERHPPEALGPTAPSRRRNPWIAAIVIAGVGGIALGGWLVVQQAVGAYSSQSGSDSSRLIQTFQYIFAAPLVTVGLATMVGLVFFLALRHRP